MMAKTATVSVHIEPELKEQAEHVFASLGISPSSAITLFYRQVILQQGIPFDSKLDYRKPVDISSLSKEELNAELEKGYQSIVAGNVVPIEEALESLHTLLE